MNITQGTQTLFPNSTISVVKEVGFKSGLNRQNKSAELA